MFAIIMVAIRSISSIARILLHKIRIYLAILAELLKLQRFDSKTTCLRSGNESKDEKISVIKALNHVPSSMPATFSSLLTPVSAIHTRTTRFASSSSKFNRPRYGTKKMQKGFKCKGVKIWNTIPNIIKKLSFDKFKIKYQNF